MDYFDLLETHLNELKENLIDQQYSPALPERLKTVEFTLSQVSCQTGRYKQRSERKHDIRSVAAPVYGTDLGVRYDGDPSEFYNVHCDLAKVEPLNSAVLTSALLSCDLMFLETLIDSVLLLFGDYRAVRDAVSERYDEISCDGDYDTQITAGVVMAALDDERALQLFENAADNEEITLSERYAALHRAAAALIKRFHDRARALRCLDGACDRFISSDSSDKSQASYDVKDAEDVMNKALYHNLRALIVLDSKGIEQASRELSEARALLDGILESSKLPQGNRFSSRAGRYASQVAINRGQLAIAAASPEQAESILRDNVFYCRKYAVDYVAEASSEYAYACFLCGNYEDSIRMASEASVHFFYLGSPRGVEMSRKILTGSLWESGREAEATRIASDIASDRLGLRAVRYIDGEY